MTTPTPEQLKETQQQINFMIRSGMCVTTPDKEALDIASKCIDIVIGLTQRNYVSCSELVPDGTTGNYRNRMGDVFKKV